MPKQRKARAASRTTTTTMTETTPAYGRSTTEITLRVPIRWSRMDPNAQEVMNAFQIVLQALGPLTTLERQRVILAVSDLLGMESVVDGSLRETGK